MRVFHQDAGHFTGRTSGRIYPGKAWVIPYTAAVVTVESGPAALGSGVSVVAQRYVVDQHRLTEGQSQKLRDLVLQHRDRCLIR